MLPIRYHLIIMIASEFIGFALGAVAVGVMWVSGHFGDRLWLAGLLFFVGIGVGAMIPRIVFRYVVPARCPEKSCLGRTYPRESDPIVYVCQSCNGRTESGVSENTDSHLRR